MGMFDDITYQMPCPYCGSPLADFQSKNGPCILADLTPGQLAVEASDDLRTGIKFYDSCDECDMQITVTMQNHHGLAGLAFTTKETTDE